MKATPIWLLAACAVVIAGCHWFRGSQPDGAADASQTDITQTDIAQSDIAQSDIVQSDAPQQDASRSDTPLPDVSGTDASRSDSIIVPCGISRPCDPIRGTGCLPGTDCTVVDWPGVGYECLARGMLGLGERCMQSSQCRDGLQCHPEHLRCLRLCCPMEGDGLCGPGSYCSTFTAATPLVAMCTIPTTCDTVDAGAEGGGGCDGGACYPTQPWGDNTCYTPGNLGEGEACGALFSCQAGLVCVQHPPDGGSGTYDGGIADGSVVMEGTCRVRCRIGVGRCAVGTCTRIFGYPTDFAACVP